MANRFPNQKLKFGSYTHWQCIFVIYLHLLFIWDLRSLTEGQKSNNILKMCSQGHFHRHSYRYSSGCDLYVITNQPSFWKIICSYLSGIFFQSLSLSQPLSLSFSPSLPPFLLLGLLH